MKKHLIFLIIITLVGFALLDIHLQRKDLRLQVYKGYEKKFIRDLGIQNHKFLLQAQVIIDSKDSSLDKKRASEIKQIILNPMSYQTYFYFYHKDLKQIDSDYIIPFTFNIAPSTGEWMSPLMPEATSKYIRFTQNDKRAIIWRTQVNRAIIFEFDEGRYYLTLKKEANKTLLSLIERRK